MQTDAISAKADKNEPIKFTSSKLRIGIILGDILRFVTICALTKKNERNMLQLKKHLHRSTHMILMAIAMEKKILCEK